MQVTSWHQFELNETSELAKHSWNLWAFCKPITFQNTWTFWIMFQKTCSCTKKKKKRGATSSFSFQLKRLYHCVEYLAWRSIRSNLLLASNQHIISIVCLLFFRSALCDWSVLGSLGYQNRAGSFGRTKPWQVQGFTVGELKICLVPCLIKWETCRKHMASAPRGAFSISQSKLMKLELAIKSF